MASTMDIRRALCPIRRLRNIVSSFAFGGLLDESFRLDVDFFSSVGYVKMFSGQIAAWLDGWASLNPSIHPKLIELHDCASFERFVKKN
ncbi:uncharacterized protein EAF01_000545 [Botrytis porri]|uniref:uncharacterized protein n=1 Tax=Botrytis porri TaxID=87229 RepID=UPI0019028D8A|nr:uncharacterized protein EAF01_000545 [Botrytis porri]KAF7914139.1 hypothetical protein EAF01_000545 [Botrytis porri]